MEDYQLDDDGYVVVELVYEPENKYHTDPNHLCETVAKYGVAIVPNVLNRQEIKEMRDGMWNYLEHITHNFAIPISRNDEKTWREFSKLYPKHSMLLQNWGIGHAQYIWNIRQNPKVADIFGKLWNCEPEDLLVSFDGASFHFPPEITGKGWFRAPWYHSDQSFTRNGFECIQSWVTAYDIDEGDATLAFLEKSNNYHGDLRERFKMTSKEDWTKLIPEHIDFYKEKGCKERFIQCKAGDMVFFDSRTIHCGVEARKGRATPHMRNVAYICMMPRSKITPANLKKKQKAFEELRTTNHYPCKPKLFAKVPRTYGGDLPSVYPIPTPKLTPLGKKLVGF